MAEKELLEKEDSDGYLMQLVDGQWKHVHRIIAESFLKDEWELKKKQIVEDPSIGWFLVVHHIKIWEKDNIRNNDPSNLQWLGNIEHSRIHGEYLAKLNSDPEFIEKMKPIWSEVGRKYGIPRLMKYNKEHGNDPGRLTMLSNTMSINIKKYHKENNTTEVYKHHQAKAGTLGGKVGGVTGGAIVGKIHGPRAGINRAKIVFEILKSKNLEINKEDWEKEKPSKGGFPCFETFISYKEFDYA